MASRIDWRSEVEDDMVVRREEADRAGMGCWGDEAAAGASGKASGRSEVKGFDDQDEAVLLVCAKER